MLWFTLVSLLLGAPAAEFDQAAALIAGGRYREARELAARALKERLPAAARLRWQWITAEAWQAEGDYEEAVACYEKLGATGPGPVAIEATLRVARCRLQMWDTKGAKKALDRLPAARLGDLVHERDELAAMAVFLSGRQKEAGKLFERLPKKSGAAWYYLGLVAFNGGDFQKAVDRFDRAVAGSPDDYYSHLYRTSSLLELNRLEEARSALNRLLKIADIPEVNRLLGQVELRAKRFSQAEAHFRRAVTMSSNNAGAQFGLATALKRQDKTEEARQAFKEFRQLHITEQQAQDRAYALEQKHLADPQDPEHPEKLALHYLAHNDAGEAERLAWQALHIEPSRVSARLCLARSLTVLGRYREAAAQYQRIIRAHPGHTVARQEFGELVRKFARRVDD